MKPNSNLNHLQQLMFHTIHPPLHQYNNFCWSYKNRAGFFDGWAPQLSVRVNHGTPANGVIGHMCTIYILYKGYGGSGWVCPPLDLFLFCLFCAFQQTRQRGIVVLSSDTSNSDQEIHVLEDPWNPKEDTTNQTTSSAGLHVQICRKVRENKKLLVADISVYRGGGSTPCP